MAGEVRKKIRDQYPLASNGTLIDAYRSSQVLLRNLIFTFVEIYRVFYSDLDAGLVNINVTVDAPPIINVEDVDIPTLEGQFLTILNSMIDSPA